MLRRRSATNGARAQCLGRNGRRAGLLVLGLNVHLLITRAQSKAAREVECSMFINNPHSIARCTSVGGGAQTTLY